MQLEFQKPISGSGYGLGAGVVVTGPAVVVTGAAVVVSGFLVVVVVVVEVVVGFGVVVVVVVVGAAVVVVVVDGVVGATVVVVVVVSFFSGRVGFTVVGSSALLKFTLIWAAVSIEAAASRSRTAADKCCLTSIFPFCLSFVVHNK